MVSQDRRIRRSRQLLARALISLTLERGYEPVTIRDITTQANVGYATFFRHYRDKNELLLDVLDVVLKEVIELLSPGSLEGNLEEVGVLIFRYVQVHSELVRVLLGRHDILQRVMSVVSQEFVTAHHMQPDSQVPLKVVAHHTVSSSISLVEWWLANQMPYSPEQMGRIYNKLIRQPVSNLLMPNSGIPF